MSAFFTPASKKHPEKITWRILNNSLIVGKYTPDESSKVDDGSKRRVAAFDLVGLISRASFISGVANDVNEGFYIDINGI